MSKDTKAALKEAKDFITAKDYKSALRSCKKVLNVDKNNYTALVFCGVCLLEMQQPDQALQAYERATTSDPTQLTGWQGLAAFFEKKLSGIGETDEAGRKSVASKLAEIYEKTLALTKDPDKYESVSGKLVNLYLVSLKDLKSAQRILLDRVHFFESLNDLQRIRASHCELIRVVQTQTIKEPDKEDDELLKLSLVQVVNDSSSIQNMEYMKYYIKVLYKLFDMEMVCSAVFHMNKVFPESVYALEWISKLYLEWICGAHAFADRYFNNDSEDNIDKLLRLNPTSSLANLAKGGYIWHTNKKPLEASRLIQPIVEKSPNPNFFGLYILISCLFECKDFAGVERWLSLAETLITKVKEDRIREAMKWKLASISSKTLYSQGKYCEAAASLSQVFSGDDGNANTESKVLQAKIQARLGEEPTQTDIPCAASSLVRAIKLSKIGRNEDALESVMQSLNQSSGLTDEDRCEALILEGELLWKLERFSESLTAMIKSAQLNPNNWLSFFYMGKYYFEKGHDLEKARKCLVKSFGLNPRSEETGVILCNILRQQGKNDENEKFLTSITRMSPGCTWACLRLGIHYLEVDEPNSAISSLQVLIRSEPKNIVAWEILADAYLARGSYSAALKAYEHNQKLLKESDKKDVRRAVHPKLQIATIKVGLGHHRDAIQIIEEVLEVDPEYVPALKCLAEAFIEEAKIFLEDFLNLRVVDNCKRAIHVLTKAIAICGPNQLICTWKLLGDALAMFCDLPDEICHVTVPAKLIMKEDDTTLDKWKLISLASKCYAMVTRIAEDDATGWLDLGYIFYKLSQNPDEERRNTLLSQSEAFVRRSINLCPGSSKVWNLLGVIAFAGDNFPLAQHAFIKSITMENNSTAWVNLGALYLSLGNMELANKAFRESQNQDPGYIRGWVGQALLAEMTGCDSESMDLFRHATFLGNELESSIGYANWICKTLLLKFKNKAAFNDQKKPSEHHLKRQLYFLDKMHGTSLAIDCMSRFTELVRNDPCALNMFGVLLEKQNLLKSAKMALQKASELVSELPKDENSNSIHFNLGRVYFKLKDYEDSISALQKIATPDFYSEVGIALARAKSGNFGEAYNHYKNSLNLANSDEDRSHVLAAMATVAYASQGGNATKTILFQSSQLKPASMDGLLALAVLGIKQSDGSLLRAALDAMEKRLDTQPEYRPDFITVKALMLVLQGKKEDAKKFLCKSIHIYPELGRLWRTLAMFLVHFEPIATNPKLSESAAKCAAKAAGLDCDGQDIVEMSCIVAIARTLSSNDDSGVKAASKVVHAHPADPQAWIALVFAMFSRPSKFTSETLRRTILKTEALLAEGTGHEKVKLWLGNYKSAVDSVIST